MRSMEQKSNLAGTPLCEEVTEVWDRERWAFDGLRLIAYGAAQALTPRLLGAKGQRESETIRKTIFWVRLLVPVPFVLATAAWAAGGPQEWLTATLIGGLLLFGFIFVVNSSVHSYLILAFGSAERIPRDVGYYYMANAAGRLIGTLLSGLSYRVGAVAACLATEGVMALRVGWPRDGSNPMEARPI